MLCNECLQDLRYQLRSVIADDLGQRRATARTTSCDDLLRSTSDHSCAGGISLSLDCTVGGENATQHFMKRIPNLKVQQVSHVTRWLMPSSLSTVLTCHLERMLSQTRL